MVLGFFVFVWIGSSRSLVFSAAVCARPVARWAGQPSRQRDVPGCAFVAQPPVSRLQLSRERLHLPCGAWLQLALRKWSQRSCMPSPFPESKTCVRDRGHSPSGSWPESDPVASPRPGRAGRAGGCFGCPSRANRFRATSLELLHAITHAHLILSSSFRFLLFCIFGVQASRCAHRFAPRDNLG